MEEKKKNTHEFKMVHMYEADISTSEKPIIGTDALATCVGVLLYNETKKQAIVAHVAPEQFDIIDQIIKLLVENNWISDNIKYKIIPGYYKEHYNTKETLEEYFSIFERIDDSKLSENDIMTNEEYTCRAFAFDSRIGQFITDKVYFGEDYYKIISSKRKK